MMVQWTKTALADLQSIGDYIARDSVFYANKFMDELLKASEMLGDSPKLGRVIPEIKDSNAREIIHGSYRIMYIIRDNGIFITQVTHSAKNFIPNCQE